MEHKRIQLEIMDVRQADPKGYKDKEVKFLNHLREKYNILGQTYEEHCKLRGKRKRRAGDGLTVEEKGELAEGEEELDLDEE
jgi:hypothetical protein